MIRVAGEQTAVDGNGFYDDTILDRIHSSPTVVFADFGPVEAGWSLRIKFPGYRSITTSVPSSWQHEDDDSFFIFFPDRLPNDGMITITPQCPN
jgi:hypothetical protein